MDPILFWNSVALEANKLSHTVDVDAETSLQKGPPRSARALGLVHLAMYQARAASIPTFPYQPFPLVTLPPAPAGVDSDSVIAGAAARALGRLFPSLNQMITAKATESGASHTDSLHYGAVIADGILNARASDPTAESNGYHPGTHRGAHAVDPDNPEQGFHAPFYGARATTIACKDTITIDAPPFLAAAGRSHDPAYLTALNEVRRKGIAPELAGTLEVGPGGLRTPEETLIGIYWGYDGSKDLGTPPRLYNQIVRAVSAKHRLSVDDNARLFAMVNLAMMDAGVLAWRVKYRDDLWRPVVGIREHDSSMGANKGPAGSPGFEKDCDPDWLPLGAPKSNSITQVNVGTYPNATSVTQYQKNFTPNFPAYPSGHATFGAAALHAARLCLGAPVGDRTKDSYFSGLEFVSEEYNGKTKSNNGTVRPIHRRSFQDGLWEMIIENGRSRVFLGVHWSFDSFATNARGEPDLSRNLGGVPLGLAIADDIAKTHFKKK
jgi:vanadium chloroperoxidase